MTSRLGTALLLIGIIILVVFFLTRQVQEADLNLLLAGAGTVLLGLALRRRSAKQAAHQSARFRMVRKFKDRGGDPEE